MTSEQASFNIVLMVGILLMAVVFITVFLPLYNNFNTITAKQDSSPIFNDEVDHIIILNKLGWNCEIMYPKEIGSPTMRCEKVTK